MTDITRNFPVLIDSAAGISPAVSAYSSPPFVAFGAWDIAAPIRSLVAGFSLVTVSGDTFIRTGQQLFDRQWKQAVHLVPGSIALGFVLSQVTKNVEVFNNWNHAQTLIDIDFQNGGAGMFMETGPAVPVHFATTQAYNYTLRVTTAGAPIINDAVVFEFGTFDVTLPVSGTRLVAFTISPDWYDGVNEGVAYLTDVMTAYNGTEQRTRLRGRPRRALRFTALAQEARDAALLGAVLYGWQSNAYGVPVWQDIVSPTATINAGDLVLSVDTVYRQFEVGGLAFVWRNPHEWEAYQITALSSGSITVASPSQGTWTAASGAWVMPMRIGRLSDSETLTRLGQTVNEARLKFIISGVLK